MIQVNWAEVPPLYPKNINRQFIIRVSRLALVDINNHRGSWWWLEMGTTSLGNIFWAAQQIILLHLHSRGDNILCMAIVSQDFSVSLVNWNIMYLTYLNNLLKVIKKICSTTQRPTYCDPDSYLSVVSCHHYGTSSGHQTPPPGTHQHPVETVDTADTRWQMGSLSPHCAAYLYYLERSLDTVDISASKSCIRIASEGS